MSFKRKQKKGKSGMGILLILVVVAILFYYYDESSKMSEIESVPQVKMEFSGGESISFYQPVEYSEEISLEMADTALANFFIEQQQPPPPPPTVENRVTESGEVDTTVASSQEAENVIGGEIGSQYYTRTGDALQPHTDYTVVEGVPTFKLGHVVNIIGKIEKTSSPQYFFNILVKKGNEQPIRSASHIETNYDGTFLYSFATDTAWRSGTYMATISTIGDNKSILTFDWVFDIIE